MITYSFTSKGREYMVNCKSLEEALKTASYHSESRVKVPVRISIKTRNNITNYDYHQIVKLCAKYGYL